jgi:hypothetical protein
MGLPPGTIKNDKSDHLLQLFEAMPAWQPGQVVFANQIVNLRVNFAPPDLFGRIDCVRRWWSMQLAIIYDEADFVSDRRPQHRQSHCRAGDRRIFARRNRGWNKNYFFQRQLLARFASQDQMRVMNGIECAAIDANFFQNDPVNPLINTIWRALAVETRDIASPGGDNDQAGALAPQNCVIAVLENIDAQLNRPIRGRADRERQRSQRNIFFISRQNHPT